MEKEIVINPKFIVKDFFKVNLYLLSKIWYLWIAITLIIYTLIIKDLIQSSNSDSVIYKFIGLIIGISFFLYSTYIRSKKSIEENPRLKENINFIFNSNYFEEKGESFSVKHLWKDIFKIEEKKDWFLIYPQKRRAIIVRKEDLKDNLTNFRKLISEVKLKH